MRLHDFTDDMQSAVGALTQGGHAGWGDWHGVYGFDRVELGLSLDVFPISDDDEPGRECDLLSLMGWAAHTDSAVLCAALFDDVLRIRLRLATDLVVSGECLLSVHRHDLDEEDLPEVAVEEDPFEPQSILMPKPWEHLEFVDEVVAFHLRELAAERPEPNPLLLSRIIAADARVQVERIGMQQLKNKLP